MTRNSALAALTAEIRSCRICVTAPLGHPLPHEPRPVVRVSSTARIAICGQAPGTRVHASGTPFTDPSGDRLRAWMGVTDAEFYDETRIAIVPMGFCFPGLDAKGGDKPPRRECATAWHARLFAQLPQLELVLLVGAHAQRWHLPAMKGRPLRDVVADWRAIAAMPGTRALPHAKVFVLPHPSWRNNAWIKARPWVQSKLLPALRAEVRTRLNG